MANPQETVLLTPEMWQASQKEKQTAHNLEENFKKIIFEFFTQKEGVDITPEKRDEFIVLLRQNLQEVINKAMQEREISGAEAGELQRRKGQLMNNLEKELERIQKIKISEMESIINQAIPPREMQRLSVEDVDRKQKAIPITDLGTEQQEGSQLLGLAERVIDKGVLINLERVLNQAWEYPLKSTGNVSEKMSLIFGKDSKVSKQSQARFENHLQEFFETIDRLREDVLQVSAENYEEVIKKLFATYQERKEMKHRGKIKDEGIDINVLAAELKKDKAEHIEGLELDNTKDETHQEVKDADILEDVAFEDVDLERGTTISPATEIIKEAVTPEKEDVELAWDEKEVLALNFMSSDRKKEMKRVLFEMRSGKKLEDIDVDILMQQEEDILKKVEELGAVADIVAYEKEGETFFDQRSQRWKEMMDKMDSSTTMNGLRHVLLEYGSTLQDNNFTRFLEEMELEDDDENIDAVKTKLKQDLAEYTVEEQIDFLESRDLLVYEKQKRERQQLVDKRIIEYWKSPEEEKKKTACIMLFLKKLLPVNELRETKKDLSFPEKESWMSPFYIQRMQDMMRTFWLSNEQIEKYMYLLSLTPEEKESANLQDQSFQWMDTFFKVYGKYIVTDRISMTAESLLGKEGKKPEYADDEPSLGEEKSFFAGLKEKNPAQFQTWNAQEEELVDVQINERGAPVNPYSKTGIEGRGELGRWGRNETADAIVTNPDKTKIVLIQRQDGRWALPGGFVDKGERVDQSALRELGEELFSLVQKENKSVVDQLGYQVILQPGEIFKGYMDDPRNTDNAWIETTAYHILMEENVTLHKNKEIKNVRWYSIEEAKKLPLYASHNQILETMFPSKKKKKIAA